MAGENLNDNEQMVEDIKARRKALVDKTKQDLNQTISDYSDLMREYTNKEEEAAKEAYNNNYPKEYINDRKARSAYLNRRGSATDSEKAINANLENKKNVYEALTDKDNYNLQSQDDNIGYKNYVNNQKFDYQKQRDSVKDKQWQKDYDLAYKRYLKSKRGYSSYGRNYSPYYNYYKYFNPLEMAADSASGVAKKVKELSKKAKESNMNKHEESVKK